MTRELLQQALDALENPALPVYTTLRKEIRMALAAPMPEPVAYVNSDELSNMLGDRMATIAGVRDGWRKTPLYAAPPAAPAQSNQLSGNSGSLNLIAAPVHDGMVMVPREPTSNMLAALSGEWHSSRYEGFRAKYRAMIAASPAAPAMPEGEIVIAKNEDGVIVSVTRQAEDGRIISVLAESAAPVVREPLTSDQFADIVAEASIAADLAASPLKLLAFAREVLKAHGITGGSK